MRDRKIGLDSAIAAWAWGLAVVLLVVMWITSDSRWGSTAIVVTAVAATATVRAFVIQQCVSLRNAFDLGRDAASLTPFERR